MTEAQIWGALCAMTKWSCIVDYAVVHPVSVGDALFLRYHVFVELHQYDDHGGEGDAAELDLQLSLQNAGYQYHRKTGSIVECVVHFVQSGTFHVAFDLLRQLSPNINQAKMPRLVRAPELVALLMQHTIK